MRVFKEFRFEAAHFLTNVASGHKCSRLHGHSYLVRITCEGPVDPQSGFVIDYADISKKFQREVFDKLDHQFLNEVVGLENSTSEILAQWIWHRMQPLPVVEVEVRETPTAGAVFGG